ncbi:MAG: pyridoxamine 5'-phosphate oxidase family protein [Methanomassiliicoccaceae archaeon]|nr:pyridoxamine 5'-phosphate oxidase family protein [Methanomassiliicoccaceae archaeon]
MDKVMRVLRANRIMTMATSLNDVPRASIMEYTMVGDTMMFSTFPTSRKNSNLVKNPKISFTVGHVPMYLTIDGRVEEASQKEIDEYIGMLSGFRWHAIRGPKPKHVEDWNRMMMERHPEFRQMMESGGMKYYKIIFETAHYIDGTNPAEVIKMK